MSLCTESTSPIAHCGGGCPPCSGGAHTQRSHPEGTQTFSNGLFNNNRGHRRAAFEALVDAVTTRGEGHLAAPACNRTTLCTAQRRPTPPPTVPGGADGRHSPSFANHHVWTPSSTTSRTLHDPQTSSAIVLFHCNCCRGLRRPPLGAGPPSLGTEGLPPSAPLLSCACAAVMPDQPSQLPVRD